MKFKPPPRFAQGFIVPDGQPAKTTLIGRMLPQPHVLTDAGERRLDDVLSPGFALLVRSPWAAEIVPKRKREPWRDWNARVVVFGRETLEGAVSVQDLKPNPRLRTMTITCCCYARIVTSPPAFRRGIWTE